MLNEDYSLLIQEECTLNSDGHKYVSSHTHVFISCFPMDPTYPILLILQDLVTPTNFFG